MRALPYLQVVDSGDGVAEYSVTSKAGWLSFGWLDAVLLGWFTFLNYGNNQVGRQHCGLKYWSATNVAWLPSMLLRLNWLYYARYCSGAF